MTENERRFRVFIYRVDIEKLKGVYFNTESDKIEKWCKENIGKRTVDWIQENHYTFKFRHEESAMAFKLVWG